MKNLFEIGNQYARESGWKEFALLKLCLCAMGIIIGTQVKPQHKKPVIFASIGVFVATYIPLMAKLNKIMARDHSEIHSTSTRGNFFSP